MRVITGTARGRKLWTLEGQAVRPTTDMVKESMFSIIQFEVEGANALDLFAGSGQLGIEALSRGAKFCVFVDSSRQAQEVVRENLAATGLHKQARVAAMEAGAFLASTAETFDLAFLDPPYNQDQIPAVLDALAGKMSRNGVILCETDRKEDLPEQAGNFRLHKTYRYGKTKITTYRCIEREE